MTPNHESVSAHDIMPYTSLGFSGLRVIGPKHYSKLAPDSKVECSIKMPRSSYNSTKIQQEQRITFIWKFTTEGYPDVRNLRDEKMRVAGNHSLAEEFFWHIRKRCTTNPQKPKLYNRSSSMSVQRFQRRLWRSSL